MNDGYYDKTLNELEHTPNIKPEQDSGYLIKTCLELRNKKLGEFSIEDLRIMIGQKQGLEYLMPLALRYLKDDPFVEGDIYEGDLLANVLRSPMDFWVNNPDCRSEMDEVIKMAKNHKENINSDLKELIGNYLENN